MGDLIILYVLGFGPSFYILARWIRKQEYWYSPNHGLGCAYMTLFWPLIAVGTIIWYALECLMKAIEMIGKPFQRAFEWINRDKPLPKFGEKP